MAAIVNDRDVLIMSAVPRYTAATNSTMALLPPAAVFKKSASGLSATPSSFVFKATLLNLVGTVSFSWTGGLSFTVNGNEATLNYASDMPSSGSLTASITVDGVTYSQTSTITTLADGLPGEPGTPGLNSPPQTAAQLKDTLVGALEADQFVTSLQTRIGLIDSAATVAGSVNARLKAESDARAAAISTEVMDRGAAINAAMLTEIANRNAAIVNYGYTKEASDQSLAQFGTAVTAAYRTYTDNKTGQALTDAKAFTQSWGYSVADANSAIATKVNELRAEFIGSNGATEAYVQGWSYSKAATDAANAAQFNTLTANYRGYADGVGQAATSASYAAMLGYTMSTATINGAIAASSSSLTANYTNAIAAVSVAGRNIVQDGAFERGLRPWTTKSAYVSRVEVRGVVGAKYLFIESVAAAGPDNDAYVNGDGPIIPVTPGVQYVIAFDYATAQSSSITASSCYLYGANIGLPIPVLDTGSVRRRASMLWTCPADGSVTGVLPRFGIHTTGYGWMAIYNFMIAAGNKDPGYSAAPEDAPLLAAAAQAAAVVTSAADVRSFTTSTAGINSAIASSATSLTTSFQSADSANLNAARSYADSAIAAYGYSFAGANNAIATSTNAVTARLNNIGGVTIEQTFTAQANAITGLSGQWVLKIDANGSVSGITLASGAGGTSIFAVTADKFALSYPGVNNRIPFIIGKVAGQSVIGFDGSVVIDGSLVIRAADGSIILSAGASLAQQTRTNANLVSRISDWPVAGRFYGYPTTSTQDAGAVNGEFIVLPEVGTDGIYVACESDKLNIPAGAWYTVSFDARSSGTGRSIRVNCAGTNVDSPGASGTVTGTKHFKFTEQMPNLLPADARLRVFSAFAGPAALISNVKVELGVVETAWTDDVITATNSLGRVAPNSITNTQIGGDLFSTNYVAGAAGWLMSRAGILYAYAVQLRGFIAGGAFTSWLWPASGSGFYVGPEGARFGNANTGAFTDIRANGEAHMPGFDYVGSQLTVTNAILVTPRINTTFAISIPGINAMNQANSSAFQSFGSFTAAVVNGVGPFRYQWTLSVEGGNPGDIRMVGDPTGSSVQIQARGNRAYLSAYLSLTMTDSNQASASDGSAITIQFGDGVPV